MREKVLRNDVFLAGNQLQILSKYWQRNCHINLLRAKHTNLPKGMGSNPCLPNAVV